MSKIFDILVRWSESIYEDRYESLNKMYNFSWYNENGSKCVDQPKSSKSIKEFETAHEPNR